MPSDWLASTQNGLISFESYWTESAEAKEWICANVGNCIKQLVFHAARAQRKLIIGQGQRVLLPRTVFLSIDFSFLPSDPDERDEYVSC